MKKTERIGIYALLAVGLAVACALLTGTTAAHPGIDEQIARLDEEIAATPGDAKLYLRRGELHRIHRDWEKAEADYRAALERDEGLRIAEFCLGRLKIEAGDPAAGRAILDRYLSARPNDAEARVFRARALAALGDPLAAAEDFSTAIRADETPRPEYFLERARALAAAGPDHVAQALEGLDEGLRLLGEPVTLQLFAIDLELERRNYDAALRRLERIASQSVRQEPWLVRKASILEAAGRLEEARSAYRQTLESLETLPAGRRGNRAVERLEQEARQALERLSPAPGSP
jgi:tetratricopeptide (TPR) repeat protein